VIAPSAPFTVPPLSIAYVPGPSVPVNTSLSFVSTAEYVIS